MARNVEVAVTKDKKSLTIKVDLSVEGLPSSSGKSLVIASTEGNVTVPGTDVKVGLNVYRRR